MGRRSMTGGSVLVSSPWGNFLRSSYFRTSSSGNCRAGSHVSSSGPYAAHRTRNSRKSLPHLEREISSYRSRKRLCLLSRDRRDLSFGDPPDVAPAKLQTEDQSGSGLHYLSARFEELLPFLCINWILEFLRSDRACCSMDFIRDPLSYYGWVVHLLHGGLLNPLPSSVFHVLF
jgi:hypothetical protein